MRDGSERTIRAERVIADLRCCTADRVQAMITLIFAFMDMRHYVNPSSHVYDLKLYVLGFERLIKESKKYSRFA